MTSLGTLLQDFRYAVRTLRRSPGFTAAAVAVLALGIGANTAIYSLCNALLLRALPVQRPDELVLMQASTSDWPDVIQDLEGSDYRDEKSGRLILESLSYPTFEQLAARATSFSQVAAVTGNTSNLNVGLGGRAQAAEAEFVSGNFFAALGLTPAAGRLLEPADDTPNSVPVAVASHAFWRKWFGDASRPGASTVVINRTSVVVIGVAPPRFFGIDPSAAPDLWLPLHAFSAVMHVGPDEGHSFTDGRIWWLQVFARLRPGVSRARALGQSRVIFAQTLPSRMGRVDRNKTPVLTLAPGGRGIGDLKRRYERPLLLLMGIVALLLAMACANVAGLFAARSLARRREIAIRASLGASRGRILRQFVVESLLLALGACAAGLLLATQLSAALLALIAEGTEFSAAPDVDVGVLLFAIGAAVVTGLLVGLLPAWRLAREHPSSALKEGGSRLASGREARLGRRLAAAQVGLSVVLVVVAGLFLRTLSRLENVPLGFDREELLLFRVWPGLNGYSGRTLAVLYEELRSRLGSLPGVRSATMSLHAMVGGGVSTSRLRAAEALPGVRIDVHRNIIGPEFFSTIGIPLLKGRAIEQRDDASHPPVAVVSLSLGRVLFGETDPIGRRVDFGDGGKHQFQIVGEVADARYHELRREPPPTIYLSYQQAGEIPSFLTFEVRAARNARALLPAVRGCVAALDRNLPLEQVETQEQALARVLYLDRLFAALTAAFGVLALLLASVGLYGILAYAVAGRTREIGVRMALGARRGHVIAMVVRDGLGPTTLGIAIGIAAALGATRLLRGLLFGLSPGDPLTLILSAGVLFGAAALAGYVPARRASMVDPMEALRAE